MESELGVPLFIRTQKKLELTEFGHALFSDAVRIREIQQHYLEQLEEYQRKQHLATLKLGLIPLMPHYHFPALLSAFSAKYPSTRLELFTEGEHLLFDALTQQKCEVALMRSGTLEEDALERMFLFRDFFCIVLSPKHPLAGEQALSFAQLSECQFILHTAVTAHKQPSRFQQKMLGGLGFPPKYSMFLTSFKAILDLVRHNIGVTIMSYHAARYEIRPEDDLVVIPLAPSIYYDVSLYYLKDHPLSTAAAAFLDFVNEHRDLLPPSFSDASSLKK